MAPTEYSLSQAFKRIEEELIKSMIRNFEKHKAEELEEGFNWDQWQVVQLRELEKYRKENIEKFDEDFRDIHSQLDELLRMANENAQTSEEAKILDQILKGNFVRPTQDPSVIMGAFGINEDKLNSLIESTTNDLDKAEHAVLRRSNDIYKRVIYDAQVYAANGGTYEQAIDMATKDFCKRGITSIVYKNGSRHTIQDYASMAIRTAHKRAYLMGEGKKHAEYGIHTVRVAKRSDACPLCLRWTGKVLIDDVYGGGTREEAREKRLPLLSTAMEKGFLHPNCKDVYSLYIEGVSKPADPWTEYELKVLADKYNQEEGVKHAEIMAGKWQMVADTRLDPINKEKAEARVREWQTQANNLKFKISDEKNHWFITGQNKSYNKLDADVYELDGIKYYVPKVYSSTKQPLTPGDVATAVQNIPKEIRPFIPKRIELVDWESAADVKLRSITGRNVKTVATYSRDMETLTFYSEPGYSDICEITSDLIHETGHRVDNLIGTVISNGQTNIYYSDQKPWEKAMELDYRLTNYTGPSVYSLKNKHEDFAESLRQYATDKNDFMKKFPNRGKMIEEILKELLKWNF